MQLTDTVKYRCRALYAEVKAVHHTFFNKKETATHASLTPTGSNRNTRTTASTVRYSPIAKGGGPYTRAKCGSRSTTRADITARKGRRKANLYMTTKTSMTRTTRYGINGKGAV